MLRKNVSIVNASPQINSVRCAVFFTNDKIYFILNVCGLCVTVYDHKTES